MTTAISSRRDRDVRPGVYGELLGRTVALKFKADPRTVSQDTSGPRSVSRS